MAKLVRKNKKMPTEVAEKLKGILLELEALEGGNFSDQKTGPGTIDIKLSKDQALWYVAYSTTAE
jgi:hypothetical protein